jgi:hypothetical protein
MTTNNETAISDSLSAAPDVPWAAAAFDLVLSEENRPVANHSVRSWAFARLLRDHLDRRAWRAVTTRRTLPSQRATTPQ